MKKLLLTKTRWLVTIILLLSLGVSQVWAGDPTLADLSFSTSGSVRIINEDFGSCSTFSRTAKVAKSVSQTEYGVFNYLYNNNTSNSYGISDAEATTGFATKCLAQSAGSGSPVIAFVSGTTFGNVGAWRLKTTKTSYNQFGIYSIKDNNGLTHANARVHIQNNQGAISISSGSSWTAVKTVTTDIVDICVIYNKSGSSKTYGSSISISNNRAHVYINGDCVMNGDNPKEFSISSTALDANCVFKVLPQWTSGNKSYVDDVQVWNALPTAGSCTAPSSVTVAPTVEAGNYGWRYSTGQTIKLTASASGGSGGSYTYQWQKYVGSDWENLTNGGSISGATSANLVISNCTSSNGGSYRCAVSTGATCTTNSDGYFVRVFTLNGNYSGSGFTENAITWTGENTGTVTLHLTAGQTYQFKIYDNDAKQFGNPGTITTDITTPWGFGASDGNCSLSTYYEGDYVFTISNLNHAGDSPNPYVSVAVTYPSRTLYLQLCSDWKAATAKYAIYYWRSSTNGWSEYMTTDVCESDIRIGSIPSWADKCQFVRLDPSGSIAWGSKWNQTTDQTLAVNKDYLYNVSGTGDSYTGTWGTYTAPTYTISFEGGDGATGSTASHTDIVCDADQTLRANGFSKTGYDFSCWHANKDVKVGGATVTAGSNIAGGATIQNVHEDITLTAQWSIKSYTLTWNLAGGTVTTAGTGAAVNATGSPSSSVAYGSAITVPGVAREGYNFTGWNATPAATMPAVNTTYTAQWTIKSYTVTWSVEGTATGTTNVNHGSQVSSLPSTPESTCDGTFVGWTTSADAVYDKNVTDNYTTTPTTFNTQAGSPTITGNITFYAVFKKRMED